MAQTPRTAADPDDQEYGPLSPSPRGDAKLQRWTDLLVALLVRRLPATFEELAKDVPEYELKLREARAEHDAKRTETKIASLKRAFERDKDELKSFGVRILTVGDEAGNTGGAYQLRHDDFYLPYLSLVVPGASPTTPKRPATYGYRALQSLTFEADELQAVVDAAACVRSLGDPLLASDAASALRKLAVDLPVDIGAASAGAPRVVLPRTRPEAAVFDALSDALVRRKAVTFGYHAMSTDRVEQREVEPYGLFFLHGHWYLAARDRARDALRNFRLDRVTMPKVNPAKSQSADYDIPADFRLREHAQSRHAWELGDGDSVRVVVELRGASGPVMAAGKLGEPGEEQQVPPPSPAARGRDDTPLRAFQVRRADAFVRWLLSFAGQARPLSPPEIVERFEAMVRETAAVYDRAPSVAEVAPPSPESAPTGEWQPKGAAAQLRRILSVVPQIADGEEHRVAEVAARAGTDVDTLRSDIFSLSARYDTPGGFVEGVRIYLEPDTVSADSNHFLRPMRLTVSELCALELGLSVLRAQRTPDEHATLERARERLRHAIAQVGTDPIPDGLYGASLGALGDTTHLAAVRTAVVEHRKLRLMYRKSGSDTATDRVVCPHALVVASGMLYLIAYGDTAEGVRVFRMDRLEHAELLDQAFEPVPGFSADQVVQDGRVFVRPDAGVMRVRYSPAIARWIAEREGRRPAADGSLVLEHPLADHEWAMRHVLQYGPDAEVLEPLELRAAIRERLNTLLTG